MYNKYFINLYSLEIVTYFVTFHCDGWKDKTYVNKKNWLADGGWLLLIGSERHVAGPYIFEIKVEASASKIVCVGKNYFWIKITSKLKLKHAEEYTEYF